MKTIKDLFSLEGKVAVVTGASQGNGQAIASGLSLAGAKVYNLDILENSELNYIRCDLSDEKDIDMALSIIEAENENVDILVNNAGVTYGNNIFDYKDEDWEKTYQVNLKAPYLISRRLATKMKNRGGSIINITSLNAEMAFPDNPAYVAMKGGLKQLTKSLACDLGKYNIRVNNIGPGYMLTEMTKKSWSNPKTYEERKEKTFLKRWGNPSDLAGIAIFLASNASDYITGQDIYVDGGWLTKGL